MAKIPNANQKPLIRLLPNEDGTFNAQIWNHRQEDYVRIRPEDAIKKLATGADVEVAVNDLKCEHTHWESNPTRMKRI